MSRFEFHDDKTAKFWEIEREGLVVRVRYGSIGKSPRASERAFASEEEAEKHRCKQVDAKVKKGYVAADTATVVTPVSPASETDLASRFAALVTELRTHPDIRVETLELYDPKPSEAVEALLAGSPFCESTRAQLRELYSATNGLELSWTLLRANEEVRVNPSEVVGEVTLVGLEEVVDNAEYIERLGDMQNAEKDARIARMHPIDVNEEGYATVIDLDADDGSTLADVGNDGVDEKLGFGVREWVERLLLCRGFAGFGPISEGHHSGGKVLVAVIEGVFGEVDVGKRLPALSEPEEVDEVDEVSFTEQVRRCFATRKIPARVVAGLLTDASETYAIFGDSFANFEQLDAALAELFRASPVRHLGITIGNLSIIAQSSWDLGHYGSPSAYWSLLDEQLRGTTSPEEVAQRYTWIIDRTLDRYGGVRNPAKTRELATNFGDLATAINPEADPELRELAWLSVSEWRSAPELIAEAKKNLKSKGAGEVVAAIEALASAA